MIRIVGHSVLTAKGEVVEFVGTNVDITEQQRAKVSWQKAVDEIKKSEDELRLMVDTIPGFVCAFSETGELELVNQRLLKFTGMTLEEFKDRAWMHEDDIESTRRLLRHSMETGYPYMNELRLRRSDAVYRWFQSLATTLRTTEARIVRWYGMLTDIQDQRNAEEALRTTQARLSRATQLATVGELAAAIAHEVNQP